LLGSGTLNLLAGSLGSVDTHHRATVNMSGGNITGCIYVQESSSNVKINISGGTTNSLSLEASARVRLSGGIINDLRIYVDTSSQKVDMDIDVIGYDLSTVPYGGISGYGQVTGFWNNDVNFSIPFKYHHGAYSHVTLYDGVIPPDCVNRPDSDLDGDCKVNFFDFSEMASEWLDCGLDDPNAC